jgi:hypothetical protein
MSLPNDFWERLPLKTDAELYDMLAHQEGYLPEALAAAKDELSKRKLPPERVSQFEANVLHPDVPVQLTGNRWRWSLKAACSAMLGRKVISTFCMSIVFWLVASWGLVGQHKAKTRTDYAEAGMTAAALLVILGLFLLKFGSKVGAGHEATKEAMRFALILLVTGIVCGLVAIGFFL